MMTYTVLISRTLAAAVYDDSQEKLHLEFRDGSRYIYSSVPPFLFDGLLAAVSKGRFFNHNIRRAFPYCKNGA